MNIWVSSLLNAKKSCLKQNNLLKVHYALPDGREMVEEYDTNTDVLTRRAWKHKNTIGDGDEWSIEVGEPEPVLVIKDGSFIKENSNQVREFAFVILSFCLMCFVTAVHCKTNYKTKHRMAYPKHAIST